MADTKISALPASTTPLAGTEVLPIVQGGVTKQASVANLTAGRAISATELTLTTGNLVIGTAGNGVIYNTTALTFSATAISRGALNSTDFGFDIGSFGTSNTCIAANFNSNYGTTVGSITVGATTAYNTTSDHRLKKNVQPMTGRIAEVMKLKPVTYNWKFDDSPGEGFIAHELAEVCPFAVTGEKDAVNEDGSIKPQSIDTSFLVSTLVAAMQEQQQLITQLQAEVAALKNA